MSKTRVVLMTENGPRILINPANEAELRSNPNAHFNIEPEAGKPPHEWDLPEYVPLDKVLNIVSERKRLQRKALIKKAIFALAIVALVVAIVVSKH